MMTRLGSRRKSVVVDPAAIAEQQDRRNKQQQEYTQVGIVGKSTRGTEQRVKEGIGSEGWAES